MSDGSSPAEAVIQPTAVFICSAGHSGSTLLSLLLGSHRDAIALGEITQMPKNLALNTPCGCGAPVRECPLWSDVVARLARQERFARIRERPYDLNLGFFEAGTVIDVRQQTALRKLYRRLVYAAAYARWRTGLLPDAVTGPLSAGACNKHELYRIVASVSSKPLLIDSSKHYLEAVSLYRAAPKRTKILLLVRDGRAVFYSGLKRGKPRGEALDPWLQSYRRALPLLESEIAPRDILRVSYENLAADPARELHRICEFIGVPFDGQMLDFRSRIHHVLSGNDMRLADSAAIRVDAAWRERLAQDDLDYFERRAGALNRALGYAC
jgi:hypothetical protein